MDRLADKVAVITGAGTGVGRSCMILFARNGARVVGVGRTTATLDETLRTVKSESGDGICVTADLAKEESAAEVVRKTVEAYGRIDVLVHSAGVGYSWGEKSPGSMGDVAATDADKWREVMAINLDACFFMCREVVRRFREQKSGGAIVNVASISGIVGLPVAHTYTAAKGAMINLTRSLCTAYAAEGIRANCVAPGFIATPMVASVLNLFDDPAVAERLTPARRPGTPEEIAYACLYLASDESSYCNGSVLVADGGTTARQ